MVMLDGPGAGPGGPGMVLTLPPMLSHPTSSVPSTYVRPEHAQQVASV
jgi:hypothetical protein